MLSSSDEDRFHRNMEGNKQRQSHCNHDSTTIPLLHKSFIDDDIVFSEMTRTERGKLRVCEAAIGNLINSLIRCHDWHPDFSSICHRILLTMHER